jgi:hypothetical protein
MLRGRDIGAEVSATGEFPGASRLPGAIDDLRAAVAPRTVDSVRSVAAIHVWLAGLVIETIWR